MQKIYNAFFCFLVVLFLAFQSYTGFVHEWFGVESKAVKAVDKLIDVSLSSHFGEEATFVILLALAVLAALLAYRGPKSERSPRMSPNSGAQRNPRKHQGPDSQDVRASRRCLQFGEKCI